MTNKVKLESKLLREPPSKELATHFLTLLRSHDEWQIASELFRLAEIEAIPPRTIAVWLGVSKSPKSIWFALQQESSVSIRIFAMKAFAKALHGDDWERFWDGVHGTAGILELLAQFSVHEVNSFFACLRKYTKTVDSVKGRAMSELVQAINPTQFPNAKIKISDERPIYDFTSNLQLCNDDFVEENIELFDWKTCSCPGVYRSHYKILRKTTLHCDNWDKLHDRYNCFQTLTQATPPFPSSTPGLSEPMEFSIELLQEIISRPSGKFFDGPNIWNLLIGPLLKKAWNRRRRIGWELWKSILLLCVQFLDTKPDMLFQLRPYEHKGITYYAILSWAYSPTMLQPIFESILVDLLHRFPNTERGLWNLTSLYLRWVRRSMKFSLLKLLFMHMSKKSIDVEQPNDLKAVEPGPWPIDWFLSFERDDSLRLVKRLRDIYADGFVTNSTDHSSIINSVKGDKTHILLGVLGDSGVAEKEFEKSMKQTMQMRDADERSELGAMTLCHAIATGLPTLERALNWAKRFIKDSLSSKEIFSWILIREESIDLLSGIPQRPDEAITATKEEIMARVLHANKILYLIIEIFCLAMEEPFFNFTDWNSPLMVFTRVVEERMRKTSSIIKDLKMTVDDVYDLVWRPTLSMAIEIEKLSMEPSYESIFQFAPYGAIKSIALGQIPTLARQPSLRFVDNLAKERDQLWTPHRILKYPAVTVLPKPLRYGLPIQYMFVDSVSIPWAEDQTPFLFARAKATVFPDTKTILAAVPEDDEVREALYQFVDSYSAALKLYIHQTMDMAERNRRIQKAFDYAVGPLSLGRMGEEEAHRTWRGIFQKLGYYPRSNVEDKTAVRVEAFDLYRGVNTDETLEWNPMDNFTQRPGIEPRELQLTYLDYSIEPGPWTGFHAKSKIVPRASTTGYEPYLLLIWDEFWIQDLYVKEGLLISILLYLDTYTKGPRSILTKAFPSASDARFPSLYLADEFLQRRELGLTAAIHCLRSHHWKEFPPTLLFNVAKAALHALSTNTVDSEYGNLCRVAYSLLKLLVKSDNPSLAIDLVLESVLDRPNDSSWHRSLLTSAFFERLSYYQAQTCLRKFSSEIQRRLKEQAKRQVAKATDASSDKPPSSNTTFVKVTTVKQLAQLLNDVVYVNTDFAIDILIDLLQNASHVDIRVSVMYSLNLKLAFGTAAQSEKILSGLESLINVAGDINERTPLSDSDWADAEAKKNPPEIQHAMVKAKSLNREIPPILTAVLYASNARYGVGIAEEWRREISVRILFPAIKRSVISNSRWLRIFAMKYNVDLESLNVPMLPIFPELLNTIMNQSAWKNIPAFLARLYHRFIMTNLAPSRKLQEFNKSLNDPAVRSNPEICHWLALYGRQSEYHKPATDTLLWGNVLFRRLHAWTPKNGLSEDCMALSELRERCFAQAKVLVQHYGDSMQLRDFLGSTYDRNNQDTRYDVNYDPLGPARPVIERIVAYVDSLRTEEWQRNPSRVPAVLPSTFVFKLWLIPRPFPQPDDPEEAEKNVVRCTAALRNIFGSLVTYSLSLYRRDMDDVEKFMQEIHKYYKAAIACELGELREPLAPERLLAIEMAEVLFKSAHPPRNPSVTQWAREMIESWQKSSFESVRLIGRELGQPHVYQNPQWRELLFGKDGEVLNPNILTTALNIGGDKGWDEDDMSDTFDDRYLSSKWST
jgi:hypothetical protein